MDNTNSLTVKIQKPEIDVDLLREYPVAEKRYKNLDSESMPDYAVLGVPFGGHKDGRDADGQAFDETTNILLRPGDERPITYYHGFGPDDPRKMQPVPVIIGIAKYTHVDDRGHWFDVYLDNEEELAYRIKQAAPDGVKASSGAISHMVRLDEYDIIKTWPLGELALFDTNEWRLPANQLAVVVAKSLEVAEVESKSEVIANDPTDEPIDQPILSTEDNTEELEQIEKIDLLEVKMDEQLNKESIQSMIDEAVKAAMPIEQKGAPTVTKNAKESASWIKAFGAWLKGDNPAGFSPSKEMTLYPESAKGAWEGGTDNEGGYTVPDDFYNSIVEQRDLQSWVRQVPVMKFTTGRDRILIPTEATAGTRLVVTDEEAAYDENEPVFGQVALTIYKFTKMLKISEELMDGDGVGLEAYLASTLARAQAKAENYYLTVGTGSGMPQGLVYASTSSAVMMATSDVIVSTDITGARGKLNAGFDVSGEVSAIMAPSVWWYIKGIAGSNFQFVNTPAGGDNQLFGEQVVLSPDCDALTVHSGKVITWFNHSAYAFAERNGLRIARNPYLYQANGQVGVFAQSRFGGAITQALGTVHMLGHDD